MAEYFQKTTWATLLFSKKKNNFKKVGQLQKYWFLAKFDLFSPIFQ